MKTKRTNRLIALVLVVVMLVPMISIPTTAWSVDADQKYFEEDFEGAAMTEDGKTIVVSTDKNKNNFLTAHKFSGLYDKKDVEDQYLLAPFKGISEGLRLKFEELEDGTKKPVYEDKLVDGKRVSLPKMIPFLNAAGEEVKDAEGNTLYVQETEIVMDKVMVQKIDPETGEGVVDAYGEPVMEQAKDEEGNFLFEPRMELAYKYKLDEYGRIMREFTEIQKDGTYGDYVYELDADGNKIIEYTDEQAKHPETGEPVFDKDGKPVMKAATRPVVKFVTYYEQTQAKEKYSEGNPGQSLKLDNGSVAASDQGIILQMDVMIHYNNDLAVDPTLCGYEFGKEIADEPTADIMFAKVNHAKINNATSTSNISMAKINVKTGALTNVGDKVPGATNLRQDTWYTIRFEIDLVYGTYNTYVYNHETEVEEQYALFGNISDTNASKGLSNIAIDNGQLMLKLNEAAGAYDNREIAYDAMTSVAINNVAMYKDANYVAPEEIYEPEILNKIAGETFNTRQIGMSPKAFGYVSTPDTARIVADPTDETGADRVVRVDFRGYRGDNPDGYYIWATSNANGEEIKDVVIKTDEDGNKILTGTAGAYGKVSGMIWGDDEIERLYRVNSVSNPDYDANDPDSPKTLTEHDIPEANVTTKPSGLDANAKIYIVTSEFYDSMAGGANVARSFSPGNPMLNASKYSKVALQVKYYLPDGAIGDIEMQMNASNAGFSWIDTVQVKALKDGRVLVVYGGNYQVVAGPMAGVEVNRNEWFTINVVFNLETFWEDIFLNGEYLYTLKPKVDLTPGAAISKDTWSIGKPIRNKVPGDLAGYYLVDDVMIFNDKGIIDDIYNRAFTENFNDLTVDSDLSATKFATNMPSSVVFVEDSEAHPSTLQLDLGLDLESVADKKIFWSKTEGATAVYEEGTYDFLHNNKTGKHVLKLNGKNATVAYGKDGVEFKGEMNEAGNAAISEIWHLTKNGVTYVYEETSYAEYAEYRCLGDNVNKNWTFANPGFGAATNTLIAADFELFIAADSKGIVQGRLNTYNNGKAVFKDGITLYTIDAAAGTISVGEASETAALNVGEWNNVSVVINIKTGAVSIYVNNVWAIDGQLPDTNISFMNDQWTPVKLIANPGDTMSGYIRIDDVRMFTVTDEIVTIDANRENFVSATFNGEAVEEGDKFFITDDVTTFVEEKFDATAYEDMLTASNMRDYETIFRDVLPSGLRFTTEVDEDLLDELYETYGEENVKVGTIILPADTVVGWETITIAQLEAEGKVYRNVEFKDFFDDGVIAASLVNIVEKNYTRDFRAMTYVEITLNEMGNKATICSDLMTANIARVAHNFLDENDDLDGPLAELVNKYAAAYKG